MIRSMIASCQLIALGAFFGAHTANAEQPQAAPASRAPAAAAPSTTEVDKPLEVKGQTRTLSMRLILKNGKERIQFVEERKDFKSEIQTTGF